MRAAARLAACLPRHSPAARTRARASAGAHPWLRFLADLRRRYALSPRSGFLSMPLAGGASIRHYHQHRRLNSVLFAPHIQLSLTSPAKSMELRRAAASHGSQSPLRRAFLQPIIQTRFSPSAGPVTARPAGQSMPAEPAQIVRKPGAAPPPRDPTTPALRSLRPRFVTPRPPVLHETVSENPQIQLVKRIAAQHRPVEDTGARPTRLTVRAPKPANIDHATGSKPFPLPAPGEAAVQRKGISAVERADMVEQSRQAIKQVSPANSPVNIEQLTQEVIRQIDHRLVAHRERMGRMP